MIETGLWSALVAAVVAGIVVRLLRAKVSKETLAAARISGHTVTARRIEVVDDKGNARGIFSCDQSGTVLELYNSDKKLRAQLGINASGESLLALFDPNATEQAKLLVGDREVSLSLFDSRHNRVVLSVYQTKDSPGGMSAVTVSSEETTMDLTVINGIAMATIREGLNTCVSLMSVKGDITVNLKGEPAIWESAKWYRRMAEQGDPSAQLILGIKYDRGERVPRDATEAIKWYELAAEQGVVQAQYILGVTYHQGRGVPTDYPRAASWYRRAVEQGDGEAQNNLGAMYEAGVGLPPDYVNAHMWYSIAASRFQPGESNDKAITNRDSLAKKMTPTQIAEAQRLAREWAPKPEPKPK